MDQLSGDFKDMLRLHRHTFLRYALLTEQNRRDKLMVYRQNEDVAQLTERLLDDRLDRLPSQKRSLLPCYYCGDPGYH